MDERDVLWERGPLPVDRERRASELWGRVIAVGEVAGERGVEQVVALLPRSDLRLMVQARASFEGRMRTLGPLV